ncbi:MAG: hypothetical protein JSV03_01055, partial [Planctomycetota bacterium]
GINALNLIDYEDKMLHTNQLRPEGPPKTKTGRSVQAPTDELVERSANSFHPDSGVGSGRTRGEKAMKSEGATCRCRKHIGWVMLVMYLSFFIYRALFLGDGSGVLDVPVWELQDSHRLLTWFRELVLASLREFAFFIPLGFVVVLACAHDSGWFRRFPIHPVALLFASILAILVCIVKIGSFRYPLAIVGLILPLLGCIFGAWIGTTWIRGWRARLLFLPKMAALSLLAALCAGAFLWLSVETTPMAFEAARVTSAEKRRLVRLIRNKSPRKLRDDEIHTLRLTDHDINVLLSWGLSLGSADRKAKVGLARNCASLCASMGVKLGKRRTRYLNLEIDGNLEIKDGIPSLDVYHCRLGSVKAPRWFLRLLSPIATSVLNDYRLSKPFMEAIQAISVEPEAIEVTYGKVDMPEGFREDIFGPASASQEVLASTREQVDNLLAIVDESPDTPPSFGTCFERVFTLARERSVERDPVIENRAGIFALGALLGHHRVQEFIGPVLPDRDVGAARWILRRVTLRGRSDWTKHFCVSAALTLLSDDIMSDAAGLLKEELDADIGGSGFSFADLLADRAGTTFAARATRDETAAREMQKRIAGGFRVEEFFPPAADLPEGIADAELELRYGGVGGQDYLRLIDEIERRLATCAAYRYRQPQQ